MPILIAVGTDASVRASAPVAAKTWGSAVIASSIFVFALLGLSCVWTPFWRQRGRSLAKRLPLRRNSKPPIVEDELAPELPAFPLTQTQPQLTRSDSHLSERTLVEGTTYSLDEMCDEELLAHERRMRTAASQPPLSPPEPAHLGHQAGHVVRSQSLPISAATPS